METNRLKLEMCDGNHVYWSKLPFTLEITQIDREENETTQVLVQIDSEMD